MFCSKWGDYSLQLLMIYLNNWKREVWRLQAQSNDEEIETAHIVYMYRSITLCPINMHNYHPLVQKCQEKGNINSLIWSVHIVGMC